MTTTPAQPATPPAGQPAPSASLAERLKGVVVELRGELDISRHVFRSGPAYVVRDPITFATHRFDPGDYAVLRAIRPDRPLGETFDLMVRRGELERADEDDFYAFILDLHQRSLLTLPINNGDALYKRFEARRRAERLARLLGVLFLRVPLVNPDRFLSATLPYFRWLFTTPALIAWLILSSLAVAVAATRVDELTAPVLTALDGNNLLMLWATLIGLKVVHEFGHAYACRAFGGHVPEMGVFMILFTPVAYVDATDSWAFPRARERSIVTLGGVYFESIVGMIALAVWSVTETGTLHTLAYQAMLLSTITTVAFNMNPLMKYDAYYLLSDLVAIPNLRARGQEAITGLCKRLFFGLKTDKNGEQFGVKPGLALFGFAQAAYRTAMLVTISTVVVLKFGEAGLLIAVVMVGMTVFKALQGLTRYVLTSEETAPVRARAVMSTFGLGAGLIALAAAAPLPMPISARGVVSFESVEQVRAPGPGVLTSLPVRAGQTLAAGSELALLVSPDTAGELAGLIAEREAASARVIQASLATPTDALHTGAGRERLDAEIVRLLSEDRASRVVAPADGRVLDTLGTRPGSHFGGGEPMLVFATGAPEAVVHVGAFEIDVLALSVGDHLVFRSAAAPEREIIGEVTHLGPVGSRAIEPRVRLAAPDGLVPLDPATGEAAEPYFEIRARLAPQDATLAGIGLHTRLPTTNRTLAEVIQRRVTRFLNRVREGSDG